MNSQLSGNEARRSDRAPRNDASDMPTTNALDAWRRLALELLMCGLRCPVNIGMILRIAEAYQFRAAILDSNGVLDDPEKEATASDFACGAMSRREVRRLENPTALESLRRGRRLVATAIGGWAQPLSSFHFLPGDLIAFGNEYDGLSDDFVAGADAVVQVPAPAVWTPKAKSHSPIDPQRTAPVARDGQPSLNVAVAAGIVCYA